MAASNSYTLAAGNNTDANYETELDYDEDNEVVEEVIPIEGCNHVSKYKTLNLILTRFYRRLSIRSDT